MSLFGTTGIRGDAKKFLTNQFCFDIGRVFAKFLDNHNLKGAVAVGMDSRESSERIKKSFFAGLWKERKKIFNEGITPVPAINYILIADDSLAGSAMITGSHIRGDYNGIKFFAFKKEILKEHEKEIDNIYNKVKGEILFKEEAISAKKENRATDVYKKMLFDSADKPYKKRKVILDFGNGCQSQVMPGLLEEFGFEVIEKNNSLDPAKFIARDTEIEEEFKELQEDVKREKADLAISFDGDGDRVVFIDEKGNFVSGDYLGSLISKYGDTSIVITPINTSQVADHLGKPVIRTRVGSSQVVSKMEEKGATFGFEANGGGIFKNVMLSRDAGSTVIKILNLLKRNNKNLSEFISTLPQFFRFRTKIDCPSELNSNILDKAKQEFRAIKIEEIDGLKIWKDESTWILFRPSSNAPEFRVFAEAKTKEEAEKLGKKGIDFVKKIAEFGGN